MDTLKPQSNGPLYSNTVIGTLAVARWLVGCYIWYSEEDGAAARPGPARCTKWQQHTNQQPSVATSYYSIIIIIRFDLHAKGLIGTQIILTPMQRKNVLYGVCCDTMTWRNTRRNTHEMCTFFAFDQWSFCLWCWSNKRECGPLIGLWTSAGMQVLWDYMVNSRPQRLYSPDKYASSDLTSYHMSDAIGLWGVLGTSTQFFFKGVRGCRDQIITKYTGSVLVQVGYLVQLWEVGQSSVTSTRQQRLALQKKCKVCAICILSQTFEQKVVYALLDSASINLRISLLDVMDRDRKSQCHKQ